MTSLECYENKWFHMKYIGKMAETESLLSTCCILTFNAKFFFQENDQAYRHYLSL